ncbi:MAG: hypothetical protein NTU91_14145 [Chloroflexi bacterium]|nr:hypothetical protein [Chloroflexota bacterium]
MKRTNANPALHGAIVKRAKVMAADGAASIFAMLKHSLDKYLGDRRGHNTTYQRQSAGLSRGLDLGTKGKGRWSREQLHDRGGKPEEPDVVDRYDRLVERMAANNESYSEQEVAADVSKARQGPRSR